LHLALPFYSILSETNHKKQKNLHQKSYKKKKKNIFLFLNISLIPGVYICLVRNVAAIKNEINENDKDF